MAIPKDQDDAAIANNSKHCIIFTNLFPSTADQQQGLFIAQLADAMSHEMGLTVVCPIPWFPRGSFFQRFKRYYAYSQVPKATRYHGINVYYPRYLMLPKLSELIHPLLIFFGSYRLLKKLCRKKPQSIISAHWIFPDCVAAAMFSKINRIPLLVTARGCDINLDMFNFLKRPQILFTLKQADHVITVSEALKEKIVQEKIQPKKVSTIFNGINTELFYPRSREDSRSKLCLEKNKILLLSIGQLHPVKDHDTLFRGLRKLVDCKPDLQNSIQLVVVGAGPLRSHLEDLRKELALESIISIKEQIPHADMPTWLSACNVLCLTSIREGRPNIVIEALACGRPIVASEVGGIPELVNEHNGKLFPAGNIDFCAQQIMSAIDKQWSTDDIVETVKHLSWENAANQYLELMDTSS